MKRNFAAIAVRNRKAQRSSASLLSAVSMAVFTITHASAEAPVPDAVKAIKNVEWGNAGDSGRTQRTAPEGKIEIAQSGGSSARYPIANLPDSYPLSGLRIVLKPDAARQTKLNQLLVAQNDPASPHYHKWVTAQEYGNSFGASDTDVEAVKAWLISQGFSVSAVYPSKSLIAFDGTSGMVKAAFNTQMKRYRKAAVPGHPQDSGEYIANDGNVWIPQTLARVVGNVVGLSEEKNVTQLARKTKGSMLDSTAKTGGISDTSGTRYLVPGDMQTIYNTKALYDQGITGKGVKIALIGTGDVNPASLASFRKTFGLDKYGGTFERVHPQAAKTYPGDATTKCNAPEDYTTAGDDDENQLDVEWSAAMAPGAAIQLVTCADKGVDRISGHGFYFNGLRVAVENAINSENTPDIMSVSYGFSEMEENSANVREEFYALWKQAAAEGISVFVSSGDSGSNAAFNGPRNINVGNSINVVAASPYVTAVGGTDFAYTLDKQEATYFTDKTGASFSSAKSYMPEIPWNDSCGNDVAAKANGSKSAIDFCKKTADREGIDTNLAHGASSSGASSFVDKPDWQSLVYGASTDDKRDIPDVSVFGGNYGNKIFAIVCTVSTTVDKMTKKSTTHDGCADLAANKSDYPPEGGAGTSLSSPMFAGIQALVNQKEKGRQGVAAATLYKLAAQEYGSSSKPLGTSAGCNSDFGPNGTDTCVFHNVTRGTNSVNCDATVGNTNCFVYDKTYSYGLTSLSTKKYIPAYAAGQGWNFATGLGSVNATNLVDAWDKYHKGVDTQIKN
ncbi:putative Sedolisin [Paraburkholderia ribeironis]|uniref:Putative Sedolisin n=1 Tax=Paraburkholderia ribeironis TaxID=1247936 RepID=A0A1N7SPV1_9BURK|nr:S53 family serine peptidase [Paraburkholderia ribeironis]SIT49372.1 putative Sedolisin [Paraburkholderia ribeironis]